MDRYQYWKLKLRRKNVLSKVFYWHWFIQGIGKQPNFWLGKQCQIPRCARPRIVWVLKRFIHFLPSLKYGCLHVPYLYILHKDQRVKFLPEKFLLSTKNWSERSCPRAIPKVRLERRGYSWPSCQRQPRQLRRRVKIPDWDW